MKKTYLLRNILSISIILSIFSCESQVDIFNEKIESSIYEKGLEINENYLKCKSDIANSGLATLLSVSRLKKDETLTESKLILKRLDSLNINFNRTNQKLIFELKTLYDSLKPSKKFNKDRLKTIQNKYENAIKITEENFEIDSNIIALSKKIINLIDKDCEFKIIDNQIRFYKQKCVDNYNFYNSHLESAISSAKLKIKMREVEKKLKKL